jgi:hypothetical protein
MENPHAATSNTSSATKAYSSAGTLPTNARTRPSP